jgi:hypothetical protein
VFIPCETWFVAEPVWIAVQFHGWVVPQSVPAFAGQAVPVFLV